MVKSVRRSKRVVGTELMRINDEKIAKKMEQRNDQEHGLQFDTMIGEKGAGIRVSIFWFFVFYIDISVPGSKGIPEGRFHRWILWWDDKQTVSTVEGGWLCQKCRQGLLYALLWPWE